LPINLKAIDSSHPLLEARHAFIESVTRATHLYGPLDVHQLCVFHPPTTPHDDSRKPKTRILLLCAAVALSDEATAVHRVDGSRSVAPQHLVYNNVGAYFALQGILTVIADCRRVPASLFPAGSQDVKDSDSSLDHREYRQRRYRAYFLAGSLCWGRSRHEHVVPANAS
ncbi:hypothetical protein BDN67DRAFT_814645, partial [Paxillus ammoniavirescens]